MITLGHAYLLVGIMFTAFAVCTALDRTHPSRIRNTLFWGLLALSMLFGSKLGDLGNGLLVVALVIVGALGRLGVGKPATTTPDGRRARAERRGNALFLPALIVPLVAVGGTLAAKHTQAGAWLISPTQTTLIALGLGCIVALFAAFTWLRPPVLAPVQEGRRLMDSIGWAAILPQMLASLGAVFLAADVGGAVGTLVSNTLPLTTPLLAVTAYCVGMALFTVIMGNAFAAFPVMTAAIGLPIVVGQFGGDPAIVCAIGMLAGFCGTLLTPMAANFNVVPANLLDLPDRNSAFNGVIRAQAPTALIILGVNILLMYLLAFRFLMTRLTPEIAALYSRTALGHVTREYPNKLDHVLSGPEDLLGPRALHPVFFGSFDWHSCVHGWWTLFTLFRLHPDIEEAARIRALADELFTPANIAAEVAYLARPESRGFERPYGWGWMLMLQAELERHSTEEGRRWAAAVRPLADAFARRLKAYLLVANYPVRVGTHFNSAFALRLAIEYADTVGDRPLASQCRRKAVEWHTADRDCQAWEPSQDEFLSPALMEAELMRVALTAEAFPGWFDAFLPEISTREPATLFRPASVSDRSDGKIAHLDGLNLSRAWCWRGLASALPATHPARPVALEAADTHLASALGQVTGDYMGEHWLASFALLALLAA